MHGDHSIPLLFIFQPMSVSGNLGRLAGGYDISSRGRVASAICLDDPKYGTKSVWVGQLCPCRTWEQRSLNRSSGAASANFSGRAGFMIFICDRIHLFLTAYHCFDDGYVAAGRRPCGLERVSLYNDTIQLIRIFE